MNSTSNLPRAYTPDQVAEMLQLSTNTVYELISRGEIVARRIGKVYRVPATSLAFFFTGMDEDIYRAQLEDEKNLKRVQKVVSGVRKEIWAKSRSF